MNKIAWFGLSSIAVYVAIALILTFSQSPKREPGGNDAVDFSTAIEADYSQLPALEQIEARDGIRLSYRTYPTNRRTQNIIVLVHGSAWHGMQFHELAMRLSQAGAGNVIVPDLRGHGVSPERRGDVDHIGQPEEDLADLISAVLANDETGRRILVGGHSSGGGLVVRFAGGDYGELADGYILLAPFLKHDAPTTRQNSGGWASPATRRIIGLSMLNTIGVTVFNYLPVISFNMPKSVLDGPLGKTATLTYSYRLNTSLAPRMDFERDLAKMTQPFVLMAGRRDESYHSDQYEKVISAQTDSGTYHLLDGISHIGLLSEPETGDLILDWMETRGWK